MSVIDKIKDSNLAKDARNTMIGIATAVASMAPVHSQAQNTERQDPAPDKIEVVAQTNDAPVNTASTINFMDVVNEQRTAEAQVWEGGDNAASQADTVQAPVEEQMETVDRMEERQTVSQVIGAYNFEDEAWMSIAQGETTTRDSAGIENAIEGLAYGAPEIEEFNASDKPGSFGYYHPGDDHINVRRTYDLEDAEYMANAFSKDEEEHNCMVDELSNESVRPLVAAHEGQHQQNYARGIYEPTSDNTWLGCEATAKINAADELGARIAELAHVRDVYIQAGGGEAGLNALQDFATAPTHNAMISEYMHLIETGQIDPMSNNKEDQKQEFEAIGRLASNEWERAQVGYDGQLMATVLIAAHDNHLSNVQRDENETRARCDQALTVNMTINGERVPVNFGQYVPGVQLSENVQTATRTLDNNPDLVAEYVQSGREAFRDKTERMQRTVDASRGNLAQNNNKNQDKVQTHTQTHTQAQTHAQAQNNNPDRSAMIQAALNRSLGR